MSELELACKAVIELMVTKDISPTYERKLRASFPSRVRTCVRIGKEALNQGVDPVLAISVAMHESRFTYPTSAKGAKGPMGVMTRYVCAKGAPCDLISAGVSALKVHLDNNDWEYCAALAQYNRGSAGVCEPGRSEFAYANLVLDYYAHICSAADLCHTC